METIPRVPYRKSRQADRDPFEHFSATVLFTAWGRSQATLALGFHVTALENDPPRTTGGRYPNRKNTIHDLAWLTPTVQILKPKHQSERRV
jgi:hypothetical protein